METSIKIEGNYKIIAGSTEWLKNQIENSKFIFGSTKEKEPGVWWEFYETKDGELKKTKSKCVAFVNAQLSDSFQYREYRDNVMIAHSFGDDYLKACLFPYLTPNAIVYCDKLIKLLADQLIKKVYSDRQSLSIKVIVE
jgi:hypothetical protein